MVSFLGKPPFDTQSLIDCTENIHQHVSKSYAPFLKYVSKSLRCHHQTDYKVLNSCNRYSLVECVLETGRKNQIRVHMAELGHPVVGDAKYGSRNDVIRRLGLHAYMLCFVHPVTGKRLRFETPVPASFEKCLNEK